MTNSSADSGQRSSPVRTQIGVTLALVWIVIKLALFVLVGRTETARFVYAGF
jgi:hypothetical protein